MSVHSVEKGAGRYRLAWLSARRRANRAWLNYYAAEGLLRHAGLLHECGSSEPTPLDKTTSALAEERAAVQTAALQEFAEYARQMAGPTVAPGCPAYAEYGFWRRIANEVDAYRDPRIDRRSPNAIPPEGRLLRCACGCATRHNDDGSCTNCGSTTPPGATS